MEVNPDHCIRVTMQGVDNYHLELKLANDTSGSAKMTVLLFAVDFVKEITGVAKCENSETSLHFDDDNVTTLEEILMTRMEQLLIKREGATNPFSDNIVKLAEPHHDTVYLNPKEQLVRIIPVVKDNGKVLDMHNILSFDVKGLPQAK